VSTLAVSRNDNGDEAITSGEIRRDMCYVQTTETIHFLFRSMTRGWNGCAAGDTIS
jgi:hypothetical protein